MNSLGITGRWDTIRGKVREKWGQLTDDDLRIVNGNVEQLIGRIEQKTGEAKAKIETFLDGLASDGSPIQKVKELAGDYVQTAAHAVQDGVETVRERVEQGYAQAEAAVDRHPEASLATMFGVGLLTGIAVALYLRSA